MPYRLRISLSARLQSCLVAAVLLPRPSEQLNRSPSFQGDVAVIHARVLAGARFEPIIWVRFACFRLPESVLERDSGDRGLVIKSKITYICCLGSVNEAAEVKLTRTKALRETRLTPGIFSGFSISPPGRPVDAVSRWKSVTLGQLIMLLSGCGSGIACHPDDGDA